ncbi:MAG: helicase [Alphaproteobacteria bacterium]|nr:helicase [Alphaproteobacteria bacterium]
MSGSGAPLPRGLRFTPPAADALREAIADAGGVEVFAVGDVEHGIVTGIAVAARGTEDKVLAILGRPRSGQVVIHNHPSGNTRPSDPDLALAHQFANDGVGFVIVDSAVSVSTWVVEPWDKAPVRVDPAEVDRLLSEQLVASMPGGEVRPAQRRMAAAVTEALNAGTPLLVEAGTGTGKSLAYLVPAALWAVANQRKVVISTHTRALQAQLLASDLPLLERAGLDVRVAVLEGRNNYLCKRRLGLALEEQEELSPEAREQLDHLVTWSQTTASGSRTDLAELVDRDVWERVESDTDLTLRMRCEHYETCHFYTARRTAGGAHLVIVNHALLMADLALRHEAGHGVLPAYDRVILDEAHHLEDVATGLGATRVTALAIRRAVQPLLPRRDKPGALDRLLTFLPTLTVVPDDLRSHAVHAAEVSKDLAAALPRAADARLAEVAGVLAPEDPTRRLDAAFREGAEWTDVVRPQLGALVRALDEVTAELDAIRVALSEHKLPEARSQPLLEIVRAWRRLVAHGVALRGILADPPPDGPGGPDHVQWIELATRRGHTPSAAVSSAPVDVAASLRTLLWQVVPGTVCTSATLSVGGDFAFWRGRHGLSAATELVLDSPFDHFHQAMLGLPRDLPLPDQPGYLRATARAMVDAITLSDGGAFVLCTSHRAVEAYARALRAALPPGWPVHQQGAGSRHALLARFRQDPRAVLVGTDSFWEGVSVKGDALRLVILPRLPFRVPTDPLAQARHERLVARNLDPFRVDTLPRAVLKLRQGYGRLLRSRSDRGVVLLLDARVHERSYGTRLLAALPPARRVKGPWTRVRDEIERFFAHRRVQGDAGPPGR